MCDRILTCDINEGLLVLYTAQKTTAISTIVNIIEVKQNTPGVGILYVRAFGTFIRYEGIVEMLYSQ